MGHYAQVINGIVTQVIVAEQEFINSGSVGDPSQWIQTSYNTRFGKYYTPNTTDLDPDQSKAFRKNYAGIGYSYDPVRDAFIPEKPYDSWVLNEETCNWEAPIPMPDDGVYVWDEQNLNWARIQIELS